MRREQPSDDFQIAPALSGRVSTFPSHCSQRPELVSDPSSSAKQVEGSRNTVVWISAVLTSLIRRGSSEFGGLGGERVDGHQVFKLGRPVTIFFLFGKDPTG